MTWNDNPSTWIDVTAAPYNAAGDGVTNDGPAIEDAIADADAVSGSTVYIPSGTYLIGTEINDSITDVRIKGAGMDQTMLLESSGLSGQVLDIAFDVSANSYSGIICIRFLL